MRLHLFLRKYSILLLLVVCLETSADTISPKRMYLDSMNRAIKNKMERLDTTVSKLDHLMDSITGKQTQKIDTLALYQYMLEKNKREQQEKEKLYIQIGILSMLGILIAAGWGRWKRKKTGS